MNKSDVSAIELAVLAKKIDILDCVKENDSVALDLAKFILNGLHYSVIREFEGTSLSLSELLNCCLDNETDSLSLIRQKIDAYVSSGNSNQVLQCYLLGIALFEIYCQANYTGPELSNQFVEPFCIPNNIHNSSLQQLECDGCYAFNIVQLPQTLLIARCILSIIADSSRASWRNGITLDTNGKILKSEVKVDMSYDFITAAWWNARATVMHLRLLQKQSYETIPTLWKECQDMFSSILNKFGAVSLEPGSSLFDASVYSLHSSEASKDIVNGLLANILTDINVNSVTINDIKELSVQCWLEWGLCCHHFEYTDRVS